MPFPKRPDLHPKIYAYTDISYKDLLKIGYTTRVNVEKRVSEQYSTKRPGQRPWTIVFEESAIRNDGTCFNDYDVHRLLIKKGIKRTGGDWFACTVKQLQAVVLELKIGKINEDNRTQDFKNEA